MRTIHAIIALGQLTAGLGIAAIATVATAYQVHLTFIAVTVAVSGLAVITVMSRMNDQG